MASVVDAALANSVAVQVVPQLAAQDTPHDFWDGERKTKGTNPDVLDGPDKATKIAKVREIIESAIGTLFPGQTPIDTVTFGLIHKDKTNNWIGKPSEYERDLIVNWEKIHPTHFFSQNKAEIKYEEIVENPQGLMEKFQANRGFVNVLSITPRAKDIESFTTAERNTIANFILTFFGIGGGNPIGITYDASPIAVRKIFNDIDQAYTYIYPESIADSATTSLKGKNVAYPFHKDTVIKSNYYTKNMITMSIALKPGQLPFSKLNPYGFKWQFAGGGGLVDVNFSSDERSGPSVNYLIDCMTSSIPEATKRSRDGLVNLDPLAPLVAAQGGPGNKLLLDIKRTGDFEQVNASLGDPECIFATIDHLASFYARTVHKNCIWTQNQSSEMVLYRFPTEQLSERKNRELGLVLFVTEQYMRLKLATELNTTNNFSIASNEFRNGVNLVYSSSKNSEHKQKLRTMADSGAIDFNAKQVLDLFVTACLRIKCGDVASFISAQLKPAMQAVIGVLGGNNITQIGQFQSIADNPAIVGTLPDDQLNGMLQFILNVKAQFDTNPALKAFLDIQISDPKYINVNLSFSDNVTFDDTASNPTFGFYNGHFKEIASTFKSLSAILTSSPREGKESAYLNNIYLNLESYFKARRRVLETLYNKGLQAAFEAATDINTADLISPPMPPLEVGKQILARVPLMIQNTVALSMQVRNDILQRIPVEPLRSGQAGGNPPKDIDDDEGEDPPEDALREAFDKASLFRDICGKAADFVNSRLSEYQSYIAQQTKAAPPALTLVAAQHSAIATSPALESVIDEIQEYWESGLMRVRDMCEIKYGYSSKLWPTDVFISMLVAARDGVNFPPIYAETFPQGSRDFKESQDFAQVIGSVQAGAPLNRKYVISRTLLLLMLFDNAMTNDKAGLAKYLGDQSIVLLPMSGQPANYDSHEWYNNRLFVKIANMLRAINLLGPNNQNFQNIRELRQVMSAGKRKTRKRKSKKRKTYRKKKLF